MKVHLLLNHFIVLYNIFGEATTPMLFYKIDEQDLRSCLKTFVVFLGKLPDFPHTYIHDLEMDNNCLRELISFHNEQ